MRIKGVFPQKGAEIARMHKYSRLGNMYKAPLREGEANLQNAPKRARKDGRKAVSPDFGKLIFPKLRMSLRGGQVRVILPPKDPFERGAFYMEKLGKCIPHGKK